MSIKFDMFGRLSLNLLVLYPIARLLADEDPEPFTRIRSTSNIRKVRRDVASGCVARTYPPSCPIRSGQKIGCSPLQPAKGLSILIYAPLQGSI